MQSPLLNAHEVAQILHISRSYVYQILRRGDLPSIRLGNALRVRPEELQAYIYRHQLPSPMESPAALVTLPSKS
jgi:excisionase family DNA binding protein